MSLHSRSSSLIQRSVSEHQSSPEDNPRHRTEAIHKLILDVNSLTLPVIPKNSSSVHFRGGSSKHPNRDDNHEDIGPKNDRLKPMQRSTHFKMEIDTTNKTDDDRNYETINLNSFVHDPHGVTDRPNIAMDSPLQISSVDNERNTTDAYVGETSIVVHNERQQSALKGAFVGSHTKEPSKEQKKVTKSSKEYGAPRHFLKTSLSVPADQDNKCHYNPYQLYEDDIIGTKTLINDHHHMTRSPHSDNDSNYVSVDGPVSSNSTNVVEGSIGQSNIFVNSISHKVETPTLKTNEQTLQIRHLINSADRAKDPHPLLSSLRHATLNDPIHSRDGHSSSCQTPAARDDSFGENQSRDTESNSPQISSIVHPYALKRSDSCQSYYTKDIMNDPVMSDFETVHESDHDNEIPYNMAMSTMSLDTPVLYEENDTMHAISDNANSKSRATSRSSSLFQQSHQPFQRVPLYRKRNSSLRINPRPRYHRSMQFAVREQLYPNSACLDLHNLHPRAIAMSRYQQQSTNNSTSSSENYNINKKEYINNDNATSTNYNTRGIYDMHHSINSNSRQPYNSLNIDTNTKNEVMINDNLHHGPYDNRNDTGNNSDIWKDDNQISRPWVYDDRLVMADMVIPPMATNLQPFIVANSQQHSCKITTPTTTTFSEFYQSKPNPTPNSVSSTSSQGPRSSDSRKKKSSLVSLVRGRRSDKNKIDQLENERHNRSFSLNRYGSSPSHRKQSKTLHPQRSKEI